MGDRGTTKEQRYAKKGNVFKVTEANRRDGKKVCPTSEGNGVHKFERG